MRLAALLGVLAAAFFFNGATHVRASGCHANDAWQDRFPSWSPTGNTIAFIRQQPGCDPPAESLGFVTPGSPEVTYGADVRRESWAPPSWWPGGSLVDYGRNRGTFGQTAPSGPVGDGGPGLYPSHDGDRVAITVGSSLQVMHVGDGARRVLVPAYVKPSQSIGVAAWSPDHMRLAFGVAFGGHEGGIAVVNADGSDFRVIARGLNQSVNPTWSPDGQTIAFETSRNRDFEIYSVRADGTQLRNLTNAPQAEDRMPAWSGNTIAFISNRDRMPRDLYGFALYTMSPDGSNVRVHAQDLHPYSPLAWSPDGSQIAFASGRECFRWGIYVLELRSEEERRLTNGCQFVGTPRADVLTGTPFKDFLHAGAGNDRVIGRAGPDVVDGGPGADVLVGGLGNDVMNGGEGNDQLVSAPRGQDRAFGGRGNDRIDSDNRRRDVIHCGQGIDRVHADRLDRVARDCEVVQRD